MQLGVENKRQALLRVIFRSQITFFLRTVRRYTFARIVNPADDVIEVCFLTNPLQVGGKVTTDPAVAFADRVTRKTAPTLEKSLAVLRVSFCLLRDFRIKTLLPQVSSDGLNLFLTILVAHICAGRAFRQGTEAPEHRHLRVRTKCLRIVQPDRHPFLAQLDANVLEVWSNFLLILHQVLRLQVHLVDTRREQTVGDPEAIGMRQQFRHFRLRCLIALRRRGVSADLFFVRSDLVFELADLLSRRSQRVSLTIESFVTMTTHATALHEQIASEIQCLRSLRDAIFRVTLLAAGFRILFLEHRPEPETMAAVSLDLAGRRATVAPVTTRTTKLLGIVKLQNFPIGVTHKRARKIVRLTTRTHKTGGRQIEWLANTRVTDFTTIDDVVGVNTDLMAEDRIIVIGHLGLQTFNLRGTKTDQVILQILVSLFRQLRRLLQLLGYFGQSFCLFIAELIVESFQLRIIQTLLLD